MVIYRVDRKEVEDAGYKLIKMRLGNGNGFLGVFIAPMNEEPAKSMYPFGKWSTNGNPDSQTGQFTCYYVERFGSTLPQVRAALGKRESPIEILKGDFERFYHRVGKGELQWLTGEE